MCLLHLQKEGDDAQDMHATSKPAGKVVSKGKQPTCMLCLPASELMLGLDRLPNMSPVLSPLLSEELSSDSLSAGWF